MINRKGSALIGMVLAVAVSVASTAPVRADGSYELSSYAAWPGGTQIAAGDYVAAIAVSSRARSHADATIELVAATNLCVAYTVTGAWMHARSACGEALTLAKRADDVSLRQFRRSAATARALSNRGVLRALSGDSVGAASDFDAASKLRGAFVAPSRNLARLRGSSLDRLAAAEPAAD